MVDMLDEDWAAEHGGEILYEQPEVEVNVEKSVSIFCIVSLLILSSVFIWIAFLTAMESPSGHLAMTLFAILMVILVAFSAVGLYALKRQRPLRIYERGILLRTKDSFLRFEDVFYVEEVKLKGSEHPRLALTPVDVLPVVTFSRDRKMEGVQHRIKDYEKVRDIIKRRVFEEGAAILDWDESAMALIERVKNEKGPVMAAAEKIAKEKGVERIDAAFLLSNRSKIDNEAGPWGYDFSKVAKRTSERWRKYVS